MRKTWTKTLAVGLMSAATLAFAGGMSPQEPTAPSNPPNEAGAPSGKPARAAVENRLENLSKQLNLTNDQKEKIRPILQHEVERIRQVRNNTSLTQAEARQRMETIRRSTNQHIAQILTPEQKKQWRDMRQERRGGNSQGGQSEPGATAPVNPPAPQSPPSPN